MQTYAEKNILGKNDIPILSNIKPIIFSINENKYYSVGQIIGNAYSEGKKYQELS